MKAGLLCPLRNNIYFYCRNVNRWHVRRVAIGNHKAQAWTRPEAFLFERKTKRFIVEHKKKSKKYCEQWNKKKKTLYELQRLPLFIVLK